MRSAATSRKLRLKPAEQEAEKEELSSARSVVSSHETVCSNYCRILQRMLATKLRGDRLPDRDTGVTAKQQQRTNDIFNYGAGCDSRYIVAVGAFGIMNIMLGSVLERIKGNRLETFHRRQKRHHSAVSFEAMMIRSPWTIGVSWGFSWHI